MEASSPQDTIRHICTKFGLSLNGKNPIEIPGYNRDHLADLFAELGFKLGAEIGVEQGKYSKVLLSRNPGLKLFCVDAWARYSNYRDHVSQDKLDGFYQATEDRLNGFDAVLVRAYSADAAKQFKRNSLDFVYIDANHTLPYVINDIWMWGEKVRPGGIISGHDYRGHDRSPSLCHVIDAVNAWVRAYGINPWFVIGDPYVESDGKLRKRNRSWLWVKQ